MSLLRKHFGPVPLTSDPLLPVDEDTVLPQPESVLDRRVIQKGQYRLKTEVLIKWRGSPVEDASWENAWRLSRSYLNFILADKDS